MAIDYTRKEQECLIDLIRQSNGNKALSSSQVAFSAPSVYTPEPGVDRNSLVVGTAISGRGLSGSQTFYYNRLPLDEFVDPDTMSLTFKLEDEETLIDLLPRINERFKINLTADKIYDQTFPEFLDTDHVEVELKVTPNSFVYLEYLILRIEPKETPLSALLKVVELDGLTYAPPVD